MNSDYYQKLPLMSRLLMRADCAWTIASPCQIALALFIFFALPLTPNTIAVSLLWNIDFFERHAVKLGSPEEARTRSYLALLGRAPLAQYDEIAVISQKSGLSHAFPRADLARKWLRGGPASDAIPSPRQPLLVGPIDYESSGAAWIAFQATARTAMGPKLSCPYLSAVQASMPWNPIHDRRGACQAVGYQGLFFYTILGTMELLAIAFVLWAMPACWGEASFLGTSPSLRKRWSDAFASWRVSHGDLSLARKERFRLSLSMGWRLKSAKCKPPTRL